MKKAVLFDLDGTLIDTIHDLKRAMNEVLAAEGYPTLTHDEVRRNIGFGAYEYMRSSLPPECRDDEERVRAMHRAYVARYAVDVTKGAQPFPGIRELLDRLKAEGYVLAVFSNKPDGAAQDIIRHLFGDTFDMILGQRAEYLPKPDTSALYYLCDRLGLTLDSLVMVGDGDADVLCAKNAGIPCISVLWGYRTREELAAVGAADFVESTDALYEEIHRLL